MTPIEYFAGEPVTADTFGPDLAQALIEQGISGEGGLA